MAIKYAMKQIKRIVYKQNSGFTMIEMMINLSIIVMMMSIIPLIYMNVFLLSGKSTDHFDVNNAMFQRDLYDELSSADYVDIKAGQLLIHSGDDIIHYFYHNNRIVRKLNDKGYIIMLEGVNNAIFEERDNSVYLTIERFKKKAMSYKII